MLLCSVRCLILVDGYYELCSRRILTSLSEFCLDADKHWQEQSLFEILPTWNRTTSQKVDKIQNKSSLDCNMCVKSRHVFILLHDVCSKVATMLNSGHWIYCIYAKLKCDGWSWIVAKHKHLLYYYRNRIPKLLRQTAWSISMHMAYDMDQLLGKK